MPSRGKGGSVRVLDDQKHGCERVKILTPEFLRICSGQSDNVVSLHVVWVEVRFDATPRAFIGTRVCHKAMLWWAYPCASISRFAAQQSLMIIVPGSSHALIAVNASGSVRNGNEKRSSRLSLYSAGYPQHYDSAAIMILAPTELLLVDFDSLVSSGDVLRAALEIHQHGLFAELAPISDGTSRCAEVTLLLHTVC